MLLLILFAFIAGVITILSPCILPILPIILSSTVGGKKSDKSKPFGIVFGFIASFTFFTLFLSAIVNILQIPADTLRIASIIIIAGFGFSLLIPQFQVEIEKMFSKLSSFIPVQKSQSGFFGGFLLGLSLGLLWTPCVGPILASVISLAISGSVSLSAFFITFSYALGTAIPMFFIIYGGQNALSKSPWLLKNTAKIQKAFGVVMIITAIGLFYNVDRSFQTYVIEKFPSYGAGLTQFEDIAPIQDQLDALFESSSNKKREENIAGKPMFDLTQKGPLAPELIPGGEWFNSEPLTLAELRGKVVLVDFWTYSCINCQRTLPYLKDWWSKYQDKGLVIIGVHSPEFTFEKDPDNVAQALEDFGITYPVMQDNDFDTFHGFGNRVWPAKYLIDKDGYIRYIKKGEHDYDKTEAAIQTLLKEAGSEDVEKITINDKTYTIDANTPETYLGYWQISNVASGPIEKDIETTYNAPSGIPMNHIAFDGTWTIAEKYARSTPGSSLFLNFNAKNVYLVMNSVDEREQTVKVYLDNEFVKDIVVNKDTLYPLIEMIEQGEHELRLDFPEGNIDVFAFTFG